MEETKHKKETEEEQIKQPPQQTYHGEVPSNNIRIGDITLISSWEKMDALIIKAKSILQDPIIIKYLEDLKIRKDSNKDYFG